MQVGAIALHEFLQILHECHRRNPFYTNRYWLRSVSAPPVATAPFPPSWGRSDIKPRPAFLGAPPGRGLGGRKLTSTLASLPKIGEAGAITPTDTGSSIFGAHRAG